MYDEDFYDDSYLSHYGVKGMRWGVRKDSGSSSTRYGGEDAQKRASFTTRMAAKKDAKEFARAKMFYGPGAGNRRKLIKAQVNQRSKDLPGYKEEFEKHLAKQDMAKHANKAKHERVRKDITHKTAVTVRGIIRNTIGGIGISATAAVALFAMNPENRKKVVSAYNNVKHRVVNSDAFKTAKSKATEFKTNVKWSDPKYANFYKDFQNK